MRLGMQCKGFVTSEECPNICCHECDIYGQCRNTWRCDSLVLYGYCKEQDEVSRERMCPICEGRAQVERQSFPRPGGSR